MVGDFLVNVDYNTVVPQLKTLLTLAPGLIGMAILRKSFLARLSVMPTPQLDAIGNTIEEMLNQYPLGAVFRGDIIKEANVSFQRASVIYRSLSHRYENFPPHGGRPLIKASQEYQSKLIPEVLNCIEQGMDTGQIMQELHIPGSWINFIKEEKRRQEKRLYEKEKIDLIARVEELRNEGVGTTEISKILNMPMPEVAYFARILIDAGRIPKIKDRRTKEQIVSLDEKVRVLLNKKLTYKKMAEMLERLGEVVTLNELLASIRRIRKSSK